MPVARGARVPPCPAFCASSARFTLLTACVLVIPCGLSRISQPSILRPRFCRAIYSPFEIEGWLIAKAARERKPGVDGETKSAPGPAADQAPAADLLTI